MAPKPKTKPKRPRKPGPIEQTATLLRLLQEEPRQLAELMSVLKLGRMQIWRMLTKIEQAGWEVHRQSKPVIIWACFPPKPAQTEDPGSPA